MDELAKRSLLDDIMHSLLFKIGSTSTSFAAPDKAIGSHIFPVSRVFSVCLYEQYVFSSAMRCLSAIWAPLVMFLRHDDQPCAKVSQEMVSTLKLFNDTLVSELYLALNLDSSEEDLRNSSTSLSHPEPVTSQGKALTPLSGPGLP
jgi:hypothetical protein